MAFKFKPLSPAKDLCGGTNYSVMELHKMKCEPCEGIGFRLGKNEARKMLKEVKGWELGDNRITKKYKFRNFVQAMKFVNAVARLAEREQHHPDIKVHNWNRVTIDTWTHAVNGLSRNDFILAAKINRIKA